MEILHKDEQATIYQPKQVFELCINQGHDWVRGKMYMHSDDELTHYFKDIITREYTKLTLSKGV